MKVFIHIPVSTVDVFRSDIQLSIVENNPLPIRSFFQFQAQAGRRLHTGTIAGKRIDIGRPFQEQLAGRKNAVGKLRRAMARGDGTGQ